MRGTISTRFLKRSLSTFSPPFLLATEEEVVDGGAGGEEVDETEEEESGRCRLWGPRSGNPLDLSDLCCVFCIRTNDFFSFPLFSKFSFFLSRGI